MSFHRTANFERHINEFLQEWNAELILEEYVQRRMKQLGIRPSCIGIVDNGSASGFIEDGTAFSTEHLIGGRNARPYRNPGVSRGGINIDAGIFNPNQILLQRWSRASLRDRIDAVIIHESIEYRSRAATTVRRHRQAILKSPATTATISQLARQILIDYREWLLRQKGG